MSWSREEARLIEASVRRLCADLAAHPFAQAQTPCSVEAWQAALQSLVDIGILDLSLSSGYALWQDSKDPDSLQGTLDLLSLLAETNAALAYAAHHIALAQQLCINLGAETLALTQGLDLSLGLHGRHGLGRGDLAAWWQGRSLDTRLLEDVWQAQGRRLYLSHAPQALILSPVFSAGQLGWYAVPSPLWAGGQHGLDELRLVWVRPDQGDMLGSADAEAMRAFSRQLWQSEWLGLLAIGRGILRAALEQATGYAGLRYQGGQIIAGHAAVQILLQEARSAIVESDELLAHASLDEAGMGRLLSRRCGLQERQCAGVDAALQVLGGSGYMRDVGMEKRFRDIHQLVFQSGSPLDMQMLAAQWGNALC